jgi:hypothetical protein
MRLRGIQVGESMGVRNARASSPSAWWHPTHHRARLADLRSPWCGYARMHLLYHSGAWVSIRMLRVHWVSWGKVLRHALVGRERLRHHHC